MNAQFDLSIIIVNWNSAAFVRQCLSSIYKNSIMVEFEIIVVDNSSGDGCREMIEKDFPAVRFIGSGENLGFAGANNLGFNYSSGRYVLFLNPDTEVVSQAVERLVRFLDSTPDAGIAGGRLLNADGSIQTSCIQRFPSILSLAVDAQFLRMLFPKARLWGTRPLVENPTVTASVDIVSGACLMMPRGVFEKVGLFTTEYFMYAEDVDLCFKVRRAGWKNYYVGEAVIVHYGGQSSSLRPENHFASVAMREAWRKFFFLYYGRNRAFVYQATTGLVALFRIGLLAGLLLVTAGRFRRDFLLGAFGKWTRIFRWSIGLEGWARTLRPR
jgi:GT2 family glycosyltransferase